MIITGIQETSLIDYPDNISTILFTQGCNFKCPYCHNPELISNSSDYFINNDKIKEFLIRKQNILDGVTITGGEPLLQKDIISFIRWIKENTNLKIKLDTNGSKPEKLIEAIKFIDYISMDVKLPLDKYEEIGCKVPSSKIHKNIECIMKSNLDYEFRTTVVPGMHEDIDIENIAQLIKGAKKYYIQNFQGIKTLDKTLEGKKGFNEKKLILFKSIAKKYIDNVEIRN